MMEGVHPPPEVRAGLDEGFDTQLAQGESQAVDSDPGKAPMSTEPGQGEPKPRHRKKEHRQEVDTQMNAQSQEDESQDALGKPLGVTREPTGNVERGGVRDAPEQQDCNGNLGGKCDAALEKALAEKEQMENQNRKLQAQLEDVTVSLAEMARVNEQLSGALQHVSKELGATRVELERAQEKVMAYVGLLARVKGQVQENELKEAIDKCDIEPQLCDWQKQLMHTQNENRTLKEQQERLNGIIGEKDKVIESLRDRESTQMLEPRHHQADVESLKLHGTSDDNVIAQAPSEIKLLREKIAEETSRNEDLVTELAWYRRAICLLEKQLPEGFDFEDFYERLSKEPDTVSNEENTLAMLRRTIDAEKNSSDKKPQPHGPDSIILTQQEHGDTAEKEVQNMSEPTPAKNYTDAETSPIASIEKERNQKLREIKKKYDLVRKERNELQRRLALFKAERESSVYQIETLKSHVEELQETQSKICIPNVPVVDSKSDSESYSSSALGRKSLIETTAEIATKKKKKNLVISPTKQNHNTKTKPEDSHKPVSAMCEKELKAVSVQVTPILPILKPSKQVWCMESQKMELTLCHIENVILIPSREEQEVFQAKQNALRIDYDNLQQELVAKSQQCQEVQGHLAQSEESMKGLNATISRLESELKQERTTFQEKLLDYKNGADQYIKTVLSQSREIERAEVAKERTNAIGDTKLDKVAQRIQQLNYEKEVLQEEVTQAREISKMLERQNKELFTKLQAMEDEQKQTEEKITGVGRQRSLQKYSSQIRIKYNELQAKYSELQTQYDELKRTKTARFDPLMMSRVMTRVSERESSFSDPELAAKLKQTEVTAGQLKSRNNELQSLLTRANATIERLNQLLARKETQLTFFHEQIAQLRQELARYQ